MQQQQKTKKCEILPKKTCFYPERILNIPLFKVRRLHFQCIKTERIKCNMVVLPYYVLSLETF